ncbi:MAG: helix-turn-helix transcriptional regulator [Eggerthellaceae bacterium]|nr:helix-turn-helix transcriptional regulator [Eggerthellaceae bacterium]
MLKTIRKKSGVTQAQLAERVGVTVRAVRSGRRQESGTLHWATPRE